MIKCAAVFSNHMVIQKGRPVAVFGEGEPGKLIEVSVVPKDKKVVLAFGTVAASGRWLVHLPAIENYMDGLTVDVSCGEEHLRFTDVAVGEVFLAGGQSNMERELGTALDGQEILKRVEAAEEVPDVDVIRRVRFYYTQKRSYFDERFFEDEANTAWQICGDEWMKAWSAVGFFFARKLAAELGCTVGIIGCNWGGTSAACWMSRDDLLARETTRIYADEYDNSPDCIGKTEAEQIKAYEDYVVFHEEWDRKAGELYATVPGITWDEVQERLGRCRYPGPMNCGSFLRPYGLYETMLRRVAPYTVQGFIYYQGENDDHRPEAYYDMMQALVACWRREFESDSAAFILTQLPMHRFTADPDRRNWPLVREAQMKAAQTIPGTGAAVIIDQGEFNEIHPLYKRRVGERLALQALWKVYGRLKEDEACGPIAVKAVLAERDADSVEPDKVEVHFSNCAKLQSIARLYGNATYPTESVNDIPGFELAGEDGVYFPAEAEIPEGEGGCIRVFSEQVGTPVSVRYQWTNFGEVTLYGEVKTNIGEPLPVAPFRLDVEKKNV